MTDFISDEFKQGLILQIYEAERNILIWQHIADEKEFLEAQSEDVRQLYSFLQFAAQTNFVLAVGKLFDKPNRFPTQSIIYFLNQVEWRAKEEIEIIEDISTKKLLIQYGAPQSLIEVVSSTDRSEFPKWFVRYYRDIYHSNQIQTDIEKVRFMRDKVVAHNEATKPVTLEFEVIDRLLKFATEIVSVFGMAYHSTIWETNKISLINEGAKRNAWFIKSTLEKLKNT